MSTRRSNATRRKSTSRRARSRTRTPGAREVEDRRRGRLRARSRRKSALAWPIVAVGSGNCPQADRRHADPTRSRASAHRTPYCRTASNLVDLSLLGDERRLAHGMGRQLHRHRGAAHGRARLGHEMASPEPARTTLTTTSRCSNADRCCARSTASRWWRGSPRTRRTSKRAASARCASTATPTRSTWSRTSADQHPEGLAFAQIGAEARRVGWVGPIESPGVWLQKLDGDGAAVDGPIKLTEQGRSQLVDRPGQSRRTAARRSTRSRSTACRRCASGAWTQTGAPDRRRAHADRPAAARAGRFAARARRRLCGRLSRAAGRRHHAAGSAADVHHQGRQRDARRMPAACCRSTSAMRRSPTPAPTSRSRSKARSWSRGSTAAPADSNVLKVVRRRLDCQLAGAARLRPRTSWISH